MGVFRKLKHEGKLTFLLALPLIVGQISQMLIGLTDTLMLGRLGDVYLAAGAFGVTLLTVPLVFGVGIAAAIAVKVSQARGSKEPEKAHSAVLHGLYMALALGFLTFFGAIAFIPLLDNIGQPDAVVEIVTVFFIIYAFSCIPELLSMCLRNYASAMNRPWPAFWITLGGVVLNIFLNYLLIYGNLGFPRLELEGAAIATVIARGLTLLGLIIWTLRCREIRDWLPPHWFALPRWSQFHSLGKLSLPTSIQVVCEVGAFNAAMLIIGTMGEQAVAAHQVVITCAGIAFMVPLGLSQATTVRIGEAWGSKQYHRLRPIMYGSFAVGMGLFWFVALIFVLFNHDLAELFLPNSPAVSLIASLFLLAALFQFTDYLQILSSGVLRGLSDVNYAAIATFAAYWVISLPFGCLLAFKFGMGVHGIWWGLVLGISLCSVLMTVRAFHKTRLPKQAQTV